MDTFQVSASSGPYFQGFTVISLTRESRQKKKQTNKFCCWLQIMLRGQRPIAMSINEETVGNYSRGKNQQQQGHS
jgi:hypothetical protein